ncbi:MAG: metallopeptidase TldD-related protein [Acidobacteriaceae bacterium]|nr:metallopeptidase TldD-related protein [Acidobacteriaceae bacterium]
MNYLYRPSILTVAISLCFSSLAAHAASPAAKKAAAKPAPQTVLLQTMQTELARAMQSLGHPAAGAAAVDATAQPGPYFISYDVADAYSTRIMAQYGALVNSSENHVRLGDIQVRVGSPAQDNTHGTHRTSALSTVSLPLENDAEALGRSLWFATNRGYGTALQNYLKVKTEQQVRAKEEDTSPDFSVEAPVKGMETPLTPETVDRKAWEARVRALSASLRAYPDVFFDAVILSSDTENDYYVSSEGSVTIAPTQLARLVIVARTRADDGMDLFRTLTYEARSLSGLPATEKLNADIAEVGKSLEALRVAPLTQPFRGPAILSGRAAAVFFHEVLGHRLEGQRQRGDEEGQTFTKDVGKAILPSFLSVADDPTLSTFHGTELSGHYLYDDEGEPARHVDLIQDGVLKTFLMSRMPVKNFANSNGHGRAQTGKLPTGRQGNLIVTSSKTVSDTELRAMLIAEAKKQGKPYGLFFQDISSGFTLTQRMLPQAFSVVPLVVYRVYVDGRPDELVRGVSIVGTPQSALNHIVATDDNPQVFNGECGAESGTVPVSAVAPGMLVSEIETEKQKQGTARPPILPPPTADAAPAAKEVR